MHHFANHAYVPTDTGADRTAPKENQLSESAVDAGCCFSSFVYALIALAALGVCALFIVLMFTVSMNPATVGGAIVSFIVFVICIGAFINLRKKWAARNRYRYLSVSSSDGSAANTPLKSENPPAYSTSEPVYYNVANP